MASSSSQFLLAQYRCIRASRALLLLSSPSPSPYSTRHFLCVSNSYGASTALARAKLQTVGSNSKLSIKTYGGEAQVRRIQKERKVVETNAPISDALNSEKVDKRNKKDGKEGRRDSVTDQNLGSVLKSRKEGSDGSKGDSRARVISGFKQEDIDENELTNDDDDDDDEEDNDDDIVEELGEDFSSDGEMYMEISDTDDDADEKKNECEIFDGKASDNKHDKCDDSVSESVQTIENVAIGEGSVPVQVSDNGANDDVTWGLPKLPLMPSEPATGVIQSSSKHPWKEWNAFFDVLKDKNYFKDVPELESDLEGEGYLRFQSSSYMKHAILEFSREREDIIRFLTQKHIKTVVTVGCPVTDRKVVNASKRLRVMCEVSEDEVCQQCKLKTFCTRAFDVPTADLKSETLDVTRVLYAFALNASPIAESQISYPIGVIKSVCHLLDEIVKVSAYPKAPGLPTTKPEMAMKPKVSEKDEIDNQNLNRRPGDWMCPGCNFLNFSKNHECRECGTKAPHADANGSQNMMPGDWKCSECQFLNFRKNNDCRKCSASRPSNTEVQGKEEEEELEPGDWRCPKCKFRNFKRNKQCRECGALWSNQSRSDERWGLKKASAGSDGSWGSSRNTPSSLPDMGENRSRSSYQEWKPNLTRKSLEDSDDDLEENADVTFGHDYADGDDDAPSKSLKTSQRGIGLKGHVPWRNAIKKESASRFDDKDVADKYANKTRKEYGKPSRGVKSKKFPVEEDDDDDDDDNDMEAELENFENEFSDDDDDDDDEDEPQGAASKWKSGTRRKAFKNWDDDSDDEDAADISDDEEDLGRGRKSRGSGVGRGGGMGGTRSRGRGRGRGTRGSFDSSDDDDSNIRGGGGRGRGGRGGRGRGGRGGMGMRMGMRMRRGDGGGMERTRGERGWEGGDRGERREGGRGRGRGRGSGDRQDRGGDRQDRGGGRQDRGGDRGERMEMSRGGRGRGGARGGEGGGRGGSGEGRGRGRGRGGVRRGRGNGR